MRTEIRKWGHSLALRIPKAFAKETGIDEGAPVEMQIADGQIIITPIRPVTYELETLLDQITTENLHDEVNTGSASGKEVW
jgi:antitoxin MazE